MNGSDRESSTQEDTAGEQRDRTADRRHVEALLDISEEDFLKELEPYEDHCYSGWDEAVSVRSSCCKPFYCLLLSDLLNVTFAQASSVTVWIQWENDLI